MRIRSLVALALVAAASHATSSAAAPSQSEAYRLVVPRRMLAAGESVRLRLVPPPPSGARVNYWVQLGAMGVGLADGVYRAPYVVPVGAAPVTISASISAHDVRASVSTEIDLIPGATRGTEDCLGPGQSFSSVMADLVPDYVFLDELPHGVSAVEPDYPRSAFVRGIEDTIPIKALVCRSGIVLDAQALPSYRHVPAIGMVPIERDPELEDAAAAAVRQYRFAPGRVGGQAVAVWVHLGVPFRR
jgi:hypothetical protein